MKKESVVCDVCRETYEPAADGSGELRLVRDGRVDRSLDLCPACFSPVRARGLVKLLMKKVPHPDLCVCKKFIDPELNDTRRREAARAGFTDLPGTPSPKLVPGSHHPFCQHHEAWEALKAEPTATAAE